MIGGLYLRSSRLAVPAPSHQLHPPRLTLWPTFRGHRPRLHTPIIAASDQSSAELPLPCPDCPSLPSLTLWPTFRGHRPRLHTPIIAASDQSSAELPLPCPDCPYLPGLTLWTTFRAHRPRLHTSIIAAHPNLAQNFPFRVQIALPYPGSPCGPLSGATDLACTHL